MCLCVCECGCVCILMNQKQGKVYCQNPFEVSDPLILLCTMTQLLLLSLEKSCLNIPRVNLYLSKSCLNIPRVNLYL